MGSDLGPSLPRIPTLPAVGAASPLALRPVVLIAGPFSTPISISRSFIPEEQGRGRSPQFLLQAALAHMHYLPEEPGPAGKASAYRQMARLLQYRAVRVPPGAGCGDTGAASVWSGEGRGTIGLRAGHPGSREVTRLEVSGPGERVPGDLLCPDHSISRSRVRAPSTTLSQAPPCFPRSLCWRSSCPLSSLRCFCYSGFAPVPWRSLTFFITSLWMWLELGTSAPLL